METNPILDAALTLAEQGMHVFPVRRGDKRPEARLVPHGHKDATIDPVKIRDWWGKFPSLGIGLNLHASGLVAIDEDPRNGGDLARLPGQLTRTVIQRSGGGGRHVLYKHPGGRFKATVAEGIDLKDNGYIVVAPSVHPSGNVYEWLIAPGEAPIAAMPDWLVDLARPGKGETTSGVARVVDETIPHGEQHYTLVSLAGTMHGRGMLPNEVFAALEEVNKRLEQPTTSEKLWAIVESVAQYPVDESTRVEHIVRRVMNLKAPSIEEVAQYVPGPVNGHRKPEPAASEHARMTSTTGLSRISLWTGAELLAREMPEPEFLIPGFIAEGTTLLAGKPKLGKSFFALNLATAVATGGYALGNIPVDQARALYLFWPSESTERGMRSRLNKLMCGAAGPEGLTMTNEWPAADDGGLDLFEEYFEAYPDTRFVVIDTLKCIRPTVKDKGLYEQDYDAIQRFSEYGERYGVSFLIIHHANKRRRSDVEDPFDLASGTTGLMAACGHGMVMHRGVNHPGVTLYVRGRELEATDHALSFDQQLHTWIHQGSVDDIERSESRATILEAVKALNENVSPRDVADYCGLNHDAVRQTMGRMVRDGDLVRASYGRYSLSLMSTLSSGVTAIRMAVTPVTVVTDEDPNCDTSLGTVTGAPSDRSACHSSEDCSFLC